MDGKGGLGTRRAGASDVKTALAEAIAKLTGVTGRIESYRIVARPAEPHPRAELRATIEGLEFSGSAEGHEPYAAIAAAYLAAVNRYQQGVRRREAASLHPAGD